APALARTAQAAAEEIAHAQSPANLPCAVSVEAEKKGRVPRNHHEAAEAAQIGDDILGNALAQMVVGGISRQVGERQHSDRWMARWRGRRRAGSLDGPRRRGARLADGEHLD